MSISSSLTISRGLDRPVPHWHFQVCALPLYAGVIAGSHDVALTRVWRARDSPCELDGIACHRLKIRFVAVLSLTTIIRWMRSRMVTGHRSIAH